MPAPFSIYLRKRLINAIEQEKLSIAEAAARRFLVSYDLWNRYQETGSIAPKKVGGNK